MAKLSKDLHSVYIDGEMPSDYIGEYETQLKSDEDSCAELKKMQKIHELFQKDSDEIQIDDKFIEESFQRLQTKMKFKNTVAKAEKKSFVSAFKYPLSFAAAAAVFALIFTPAYVKSSGKSETKIQAIAMAEEEIKPVSENNVVIDGNLEAAKVSSALSVAADFTKSTETSDSVTNYQQKTVRASSVASYGGNSSRNFGGSMPSVDVFKPKSSSSNQLKMNVPAFNDIPAQRTEE